MDQRRTQREKRDNKKNPAKKLRWFIKTRLKDQIRTALTDHAYKKRIKGQKSMLCHTLWPE